MKLPTPDEAVAQFGLGCLHRFVAIEGTLVDWSADKYGLIGIAFALQSFLLVPAFVVVIGAVVGATVVERIGAISVEGLREHVR